MCKPATLVFWNVARSCRILPATQYSTCHTCLRKQDTDMFSDIKHAKTCQYTTWQKQTCQNMAVNHLKLFHNSNLPKHVSRPPVRSVSANSINTKHYIACQKCLSEHDKQAWQRITSSILWHQTCQNVSGYHLSNMPKHVRIPSIKHVWVKSYHQTWQYTTWRNIKKLMNSNRTCSSVSVDLQWVCSNHLLLFQTAPPTGSWVQRMSKMSSSLQGVIVWPGLQSLQRGSSFGFQLISQCSQIGRWASA